MDEKLDLTVKHPFLIKFWIFVTLTGFHVGYVMAYTNQTATAIDIIFGWSKEESTLNQSLIGSIGVAGMMLGSSIGGKLITYGRMKVLKYAALLGIIGCSMTVYELSNNLILFFRLLIFGRFLYGVATGLIAIAVPRYIEEILP